MLRWLLSCTGALCFVCATANAGDEPAKAPSTRMVIQKYYDELVSTWREYPSDKGKDQRAAKLKILGEKYPKEIAKAELPLNLTIQKAADGYIEALDKLKAQFKAEKYTTTRTQFATTATLMFKREFKSAGDFAEARGAQQLFEVLMDQLEQARDGLRALPDIQPTAYAAVNEMVGGLLAKAPLPAGADSVETLDKNLKEARRRFPVSDKLKTNEKIIAILEARAKELQVRMAKQ